MTSFQPARILAAVPDTANTDAIDIPTVDPAADSLTLALKLAERLRTTTDNLTLV